MIAKSDTEKTSLIRKIGILKDQIIANNQVPNENATDLIHLDEDLAAMKSKYLILETKCNALEKSQNDWKVEKSKMQKVVGNLKVEIEDLKVKLEESKNTDPISQSSLITNATTKPATSWFSSIATSKPTQSTLSEPASQSVSGTKSADTTSSAPQPQQTTTNLPVPVVTITKSWWNRPVSSTVPVASSIPAVSNSAEAVIASATSPHPISPSASISATKAHTESIISLTNVISQVDMEKVKAMEQELQTLKKELEAAKIPPLPQQTNEYETLKAEYDEQARLYQDATAKLKVLERDLLGAKEVADSSSAQIQELQSSINKQLRTLIEEEDQIKSLLLKIESLNQELKAKTNEYNNCSKEFNAKTSQQEQHAYQLQATLDSVIKEKSELQFTIKDLSLKCELHESQILKLEIDISSKSEAFMNLSNEFKIINTKLLTLSENNTSGENADSSSAINSLQEEFKKQIETIKLESVMSKQALREQQEAHRKKLLAISDERKKVEDTSSEEKIVLIEQYTTITQNVVLLESEVAEKTSLVDSLNEKLITYQATISTRDKTLNELLGKYLDIESKLNEEKHLQDTLSSLKADLQGKDELVSSLKKQNESLIHNIEELTSRIQKISSTATAATDENETKKCQIHELQDQVKKLNSSLEAAVTQSNAYNKKITEMTLEIEKKNTEVISITKKADTSKLEIENLQKQIARNKETSDQVSKNLQDQINQVLDSKAAAEKKIKSDFEEKYKKEKFDMDEKKMKMINDAEAKFTKEKIDLGAKFNAEKQKLCQDIEKQKKEIDMMKADSCKKEDLVKAQTRVKSLETELVAMKADTVKTAVSFHAKIAENAKELSLKQEEILKLSESISTLQAKHDLLMQENEVAQSNYERNLKGVTEKEEALKRLKAIKDDLAASERTLRGSVARLEREKEILHREIETLKSDIAIANTKSEKEKQLATEELQKSSSRLKEIENEIQSAKLERDSAVVKLEEFENERALSEKKATQMVKDLQKQLAKQRKNGNDDGYEIKTISSNKDTKSGSNSEEGALLIQENEALIKRASMFEEEVLRFTYFSNFILFIFSCEQLTIT